MNQISVEEFKKRVYEIKKKEIYLVGDKQYITRAKNKSKSHIWDGKDTYCTMWSTGGLSKRANYIEGDTTKKEVCKMCLIKYYERHKSLPKGIENDQQTDLYKQIFTTP